MSIHTVPIQLADASTERLVKRMALGTFRTLRVASDQLRKVPGVLAQAGADIKCAWQESAHPKA